ncbi:N(6)-adenine-specific methyltransferase METTL4 [Drosophila willistoni]|nr:N(6)-adenine-specific methyltransferase METTL4 [Drosophila willistoni]
MEWLPAKGNNEETGKVANAIFLDHRKLINDALSCSLVEVEGMKYKCKLKKQLFQYHTKTRPQGNPRKRKRVSSVPELIQEDPVHHYLNILPEPERAQDEDDIALARIWEDPYAMPTFHGANTSGWTQRFRNTSTNPGISYFIPNDSRFYNHNVDQLAALMPQLMPSYDIIILDPPWRNKYIRRLNRAKEDLGYAMLDNEKLCALPLSQLINKRTLVAIWCTNAMQHQTDLEKQLLPSWNLCLLHKMRWYKLNSDHHLVGPVQVDLTQKQPYEMLYLACHPDALEGYATAAAGLKQTELLLSVPSIVHSHKPPLLPWLRQHVQLPESQSHPECLELFARYLQPQCTSIGLEVLKLMDARLFDLQREDSFRIVSPTKRFKATNQM